MMRGEKLKIGTAIGAAMLLAIMALRADEPAATIGQPERTYSGTIVSIDTNEQVLTVKWWGAFKKTFNIGDNCAVSQLENSKAKVADLRPGEKVTVGYQDAQGVLIANRIEQEPMRFAGMVEAIASDRSALTLRGTMFNKQWIIAADCKVTLRNGKPGTFADIQVGNYVTVTYETPGGKAVARQIAQTSIPFIGTLTAVDLEEKTVKAEAAFGTKKFHVADHCAILVNGKPDGRLSDLKLNDKLLFNYDEINGINVVNRIAPANAQTNSVTATEPLIMN